MNKVAFTMKLKPGQETEYKKRHDEIWPELKQLLSDKGISDYSIFLDEQTLTLFAVQKLADNFKASDIHDDPLVKKWWAYMKDIMLTNDDNSPIEKPLIQMFHMD